MQETLSAFPTLAKASRKEEINMEESGIVLNGAKVVFDKEVALVPVTLITKKEKSESDNYR